MKRILVCTAFAVLSSALVAGIPQPSWTNHNNIAGSQDMMTNFRPWAEGVETSVGETRQIVATWEDFLDGSNVVFSITNYYSGTYSVDHAKLTIREMRPGSSEYTEVYNSRSEIREHVLAMSNTIDRIIREEVSRVLTELDAKADKSWGRFTSTGGVNPDSDAVWITEKQLRIAGGMEYERVAVGEGAVYVLASHGQTPYLQGDEGALMLHDDGGTNFFGMARSDSFTIGCNTSGISTSDGIVHLVYSVTMSDHPCVWYTASLGEGMEWEQLNTPDGSPVPGASKTVTWDESPSPGIQECYINCGSDPSGFYRATIEVAGDARFRTNMPSEIPSFFCTDDATRRVKIVWDGGEPKFVEAN